MWLKPLSKEIFVSLLSELRVPETHTVESGYVTLMESHLHYLRTSKNTTLVTTTGDYAEKYIGDFYGLLDYLTIDKKYRYFVLRMNGMASSEAYDGTRLSFLIPNYGEADSFLDIYTSLED